MNIVNKFLNEGEYFKEVTLKTTIYLHHTAGGHNPENVIAGWNSDKNSLNKQIQVGTHYLIGGKSTSLNSKDDNFDGVIYKCIDDKYWIHHLGTKLSNNKKLNQQSIGIEICNYGPITKGSDGKFYNYVNKEVPKEMVCELNKPFRGYKFYHKYTSNQISSLKQLILHILQNNPSISKETLLTSDINFEISEKACQGISGIYSHSNVRKDKFDIFPQQEIIDMLKTI